MDLGWSATEPTVIGDLTLLPRNCRWESNKVPGLLVEKVRNITTGGRRYDWEFFRRIYREFVFRFPEDENDEFQAMFEAAIASDIWFVPNSTDISSKMHIRSEDDDYLPQNIGGPGSIRGSMQMWVEWTWRISTETEAV
jgi:hypothetical protein